MSNIKHTLYDVLTAVAIAAGLFSLFVSEFNLWSI